MVPLPSESKQLNARRRATCECSYTGPTAAQNSSKVMTPFLSVSAAVIVRSASPSAAPNAPITLLSSLRSIVPLPSVSYLPHQPCGRWARGVGRGGGWVGTRGRGAHASPPSEGLAGWGGFGHERRGAHALKAARSSSRASGGKPSRLTLRPAIASEVAGARPTRAAARIAARHSRRASLKSRKRDAVAAGSGVADAASPPTHGLASTSLTVARFAGSTSSNRRMSCFASREMGFHSSPTKPQFISRTRRSTSGSSAEPSAAHGMRGTG